MQYSILDFLYLLGGLGVFIYGMKVMSDALQKFAGGGLRAILRSMTSNRIMGVFTGFLVTALIQSSSATTVMVVSFVNAGLLTLTESMGVIMGANVGTTITAWIVSLLGFKVKIASFALPVIGVSFILMFLPSKKWRNIGEISIGFGLLFIGLSFLKDSVPDIQDNPEALSFIAQFTNSGFLSVLFFVLVGLVLTVVVQSSSASLAITLVMVAEGWIDFTMAAAMFLGGNVGTTVTAILAALIGNIHAKRAALFHCIFNLLGIVWVLIVLDQLLLGIDHIMIYLFGESSLENVSNKENTTIALSIFHTVFNIINTVILIFFVDYLERLVVILMPSKTDEDEFTKLEYISGGMMHTPELSIANARMELLLFARVIDKISVSFNALFFDNPKNKNKLLKKIKKLEDVTDRIEMEISGYLTKCAEGELSTPASKRIRSMLKVINEMERIADIFYQLSLLSERMEDQKIKLKDEAKSELQKMSDMVYESIKQMRLNLELKPSELDLEYIYKCEKELNEKRDIYQKTHYERIENNVYSLNEGLVFLDLIHGLERIGDHLVNIGESIKTEA